MRRVLCVVSVAVLVAACTSGGEASSAVETTVTSATSTTAGPVSTTVVADWEMMVGSVDAGSLLLSPADLWNVDDEFLTRAPCFMLIDGFPVSMDRLELAGQVEYSGYFIGPFTAVGQMLYTGDPVTVEAVFDELKATVPACEDNGVADPDWRLRSLGSFGSAVVGGEDRFGVRAVLVDKAERSRADFRMVFVRQGPWLQYSQAYEWRGIDEPLHLADEEFTRMVTASVERLPTIQP